MLNIDLLSEYVNIGQEDVKNIKDKEIILVLGKTNNLQESSLAQAFKFS